MTALDWFFDKIKGHFSHDGELYEVAQMTFELAKEMEKQHIIDANIAGMEFIPVDSSRYQQDAEQYYNET